MGQKLTGGEIRSSNSPSASTARRALSHHRRIKRCSVSQRTPEFPSRSAIPCLLLARSAAQAHTPAGERRPATFPGNYITTGYFDPSCVTPLAMGMFSLEVKPPSGTRTEPPTTSMCVPNLSGLPVFARANRGNRRTVSVGCWPSPGILMIPAVQVDHPGRRLRERWRAASCTNTVFPRDRATGLDPAAHADSVHG